MGRGSASRAGPVEERCCRFAKGEIIYRLAFLSLTILVGAVMLIGCAGSPSASKKDPATGRSDASLAKPSYAPPVPRPWPTQSVGPAMAACKHAVAKASSLSASAKREISEPCDSMDERVKENEAIVRSVCQELASATPTSSVVSARRVSSDCYDEYAKTLAGALNLK
jgi:hypothetical protein